MQQIFQNRNMAGCQLAETLTPYKGNKDTIVLALPRGGVPVAYEMSKILDLPLDIILVRKLGAPEHEELAIGAIASGGETVLNKAIVERLNLSDDDIARVIKREKRELERRMRMYKGNRPQVDFRAKKIILVDDGLATGATMLAAIYAVKQQSLSKVIVAVPVVTKEALLRIRANVDDIVYLTSPDPFKAVGCWY